MKKVFIPWMALVLLLSACQHKATLPEASLAAYEVYSMFSNHEKLTVALVGDYMEDSATLNAVMLQASDSLSWCRLLDDFGLGRFYMQLSQDTLSSDLKQGNYNVAESRRESRIFLERQTDSIAQRMQMVRESRDSSLYMHSASPLLDSLNREKRIGSAMSIDLRHGVVWIFVYTDGDQLHDIVNFLYGRVYANYNDSITHKDEPRIYTRVVSTE